MRTEIQRNVNIVTLISRAACYLSLSPMSDKKVVVVAGQSVGISVDWRILHTKHSRQLQQRFITPPGKGKGNAASVSGAAGTG